MPLDFGNKQTIQKMTSFLLNFNFNKHYLKCFLHASQNIESLSVFSTSSTKSTKVLEKALSAVEAANTAIKKLSVSKKMTANIAITISVFLTSSFIEKSGILCYNHLERR